MEDGETFCYLKAKGALETRGSCSFGGCGNEGYSYYMSVVEVE